jgi:hypothetical protein
VLDQIALVAAIALPLWNIPLILRIVQRKSSDDISLMWVVGVWTCLVLMAPSGFKSPDLVWKMFNIVNIICFTGVLIVVLIYHKRKN